MTASDAREVEWQFDAVDLRPVVRWLEASADGGAPGTFRATAGASVTQVDVYLDTEDRRLQRAGYALRVRRVGRARRAGGEATLKGLDGAAAGGDGPRVRRELSQRLAAVDPLAIATAEGPVADRVRAVAGSKRLQQLFEVRTRRRVFSLELDGAPAAEVALDETAIRAADAGPPARLRRVEVEVPEAAVRAFRPLVDGLRSACSLQPALLSKFEAGLLSAGLPPPQAETFGPTELGPDATLGEVALAVVRRQLAQLRAKEPGTRLGDDVEELHDMRVASRRLRASLSLFADALPEPVVAAADDLRWVGGVLGAVRDVDVQLEQLADWLAEAAPEDRDALESLRSVLEGHRDAARAALLEALDSRRYDTFVKRLGRALRARRGGAQPPANMPARAVAPDLIERRFRAVRKGGKAITPASPPADYHRLRIRAKRLRYALEFLADVYPGSTRPLVRRLVALQDVLGRHQDAAVAIARLRALAVAGDARWPAATTFAMGEVAGRYRETMDALELQFPEVFARATGQPWRAFRNVIEASRPAPPGRAHADRPASDDAARAAAPATDGSAPGRAGDGA
jgi:CHAD domain-containing protein